MIGRAVRRHNAARPAVRVAETLIHTGQHYDPGLSQVFFDQLDIRPRASTWASAPGRTAGRPPRC